MDSRWSKRTGASAVPLAFMLFVTTPALAFGAEGEHPVERTYVTAPPAPARQSAESARQKSAGCISCHTASDAKTMHVSPAVKIGCTDCHGGDSAITLPAGATPGTDGYRKTLDAAHVLPRYPASWNYPSSAIP